MCKNVTVVGLGNILLKDEGVGVWIARALKEKNLTEDIDIIEGETAILDIFLSFKKNVKKLVIIDAIWGEGEPGNVYRLLPEDLFNISGTCVSLHHVGLLETLAITKKIVNATLETVIIGIVPKEIDWGIGVTPEIKRKFPDIIDMILKEVADDCDRKETTQ